MHIRIADVMSKGNQSIRTLEECTCHYLAAEDYFSLKQTIASIETFLLLFNPYTKYDLCRYWQKLEGQGYDPVVEYNKGLELFDMHFSPKPEDLFTIILQISRFLKEFSDFETKNTPKFRHPFIRGKIIEKKKGSQNGDEPSWFPNKDIFTNIVDPSTVKQIENSKGFQGHNSQNDEEKFDVFSFLKANSKEVHKLVTEQENSVANRERIPFQDLYTLDSELEKKKELMAEEDNMISFLYDIGLEDEIKIMEMTEDLMGPVLRDHEVFNIDVPSGRVRTQSSSA